MLKQLFTKLFHKDDKPETFDFIAEPGEEYIPVQHGGCILQNGV